MPEARSFLPGLQRAALAAVPTQGDLTAAELAIVAGWYADQDLVEIGRPLNLTRQAVAQKIRQMRLRGVDLPERVNSWRANRQKAAARAQQSCGEAANG